MLGKLGGLLKKQPSSVPEEETDLQRPRQEATARAQLTGSPAADPAQPQTWLNAHFDPVAGLNAFTGHMQTCDLYGDGDWRLAVADLSQQLKVCCRRICSHWWHCSLHCYSLFTACLAQLMLAMKSVSSRMCNLAWRGRSFQQYMAASNLSGCPPKCTEFQMVAEVQLLTSHHLLASLVCLQIYKGIQMAAELQLPTLPSAATSFYPDSQQPRVPVLAVASGWQVLMFRQLRPFYKFTLPVDTPENEERSIW